MENIYKFSRNELVNLGEQFERFKKEIKPESLSKNDNDIKKILNLKDTEFDELEQLTNLDKIFQPHENIIRIPNFDITSTHVRHKTRLTSLDFTDGSTNFHTFREIYKTIERQKSGAERKGPTFGKSIYCYKFVKNNFKPINKNEILIEEYSDIVISIRFYRPFRYQKNNSTFGPCFAEEFLVLGSQNLTELLERIDCISNNRCLFDISENPNQELPKPSHNSSFFFISNVFYNDTRLSENIDYSENIRDWYKMQNKNEEEVFQFTSMEKTKFIDLNIRLGYPQVYFHQGNCEHLFTFSKVHLISKSDHLRKSDYPILQSFSLEKAILCSLCGLRQYLMIVKNSNKHVHDPAYLCRQCFQKYHYVDGVKCNNFKAYKLNPTEVVSEIDTSGFDLNVEE